MSAVRRGFTLLEVLVALVLVAGGVVATIGTVSASLRGASLARAHARGVALANARMNELVLAVDDSLAYYARPRAGAFVAPFEAYRWRARLARRPLSPGLVVATVAVTWTSGEYRLETELFRRDLLPTARWRPR